MDSIHINYVAILVAVVANFILGFLWYTPLFGKLWAKELGLDTTQPPQQNEMIRGMAFMVIGSFFLAWVLAHNMAAWSFVPEMKDSSMTRTVFSTAIFTWLGFFLPVELSRVAWERRSWTFFFINAGYHLASVFVIALVLTLMHGY